jgi:hypothetical protein
MSNHGPRAIKGGLHIEKEAKNARWHIEVIFKDVKWAGDLNGRRSIPLR